MKYLIFFIALYSPVLLSAQLSVAIKPKQVSCYGAVNGIAKAIATGGTAPYTYTWSNGGTSQTIGQLATGTYTVTVQDASLLLATASTTITQPTALEVTAFSQSQLCEVAPDGLAVAVADGGTPGYTYLWSNGGTTSQINELSAGTYTVTVTDAKGCTTTNICIVNYWGDGVYLMINKQSATCAFEDGSAAVTPMTGTPPYLYQWNTGSTDSSISGVSAGFYYITVTDSKGCVAQNSILIHDDSAFPSYVELQDPLCMNQMAIFSHPVPAIYTDITWTLNSALDQILEGQGTDSIQVQWANTGSKSVKVEYGENGISCGSITYLLKVAVCADVSNPLLPTVKVSPNPFADFLKIDLPEGMDESADIALMDFSGKIVLKTTLNSSTNLLIPNIPAGIYTLKITAGNFQSTQIVIKR